MKDEIDTRLSKVQDSKDESHLLAEDDVRLLELEPQGNWDDSNDLHRMSALIAISY